MRFSIRLYQYNVSVTSVSRPQIQNTLGIEGKSFIRGLNFNPYRSSSLVSFKRKKLVALTISSVKKQYNELSIVSVDYSELHGKEY
jgi:hypothetical protein